MLLRVGKDSVCIYIFYNIARSCECVDTVTALIDGGAVNAKMHASNDVGWPRYAPWYTLLVFLKPLE